MALTFPQDYRSQFLIIEEGDLPGGDGVAHITTRSTKVVVFPGLRSLSVEDSAGQVIGLMLGWPMTPETQRMHRDVLRLGAPCPTDPGKIDRFIEDHIYTLAGPFIFLLDLAGCRRLYLDACGSLSVVYDPAIRRIAATGLLLLTPEASKARFRQHMYDKLDVLKEGWFIGGLTAHEGISRLMPNFYLDLDSYRTHRHWPTAPIPRSTDPQATCNVIAQQCRNSIAATLRDGGVNMALTAGNETRLMLSLVGDMQDDLHFFTVNTPGTHLDVHVARQLAKMTGANHRLLDEVRATPEQQDDWHSRTGYTFGGSNMFTHPTIAQLADQPYFIGGLGGEIGRGFFWRESDTDETPLTARDIWARTGMPPDATGLQMIEDWLPGVAHLPGLLQLDLAYLELRMGCWGFAVSYANPVPIDIHPLVSRASFTAMLSMPPEWRRIRNRSNRMILEIIHQNRPELLQIPINSYGGMRDHWRLIKRAVTAPHLITKKLRKMFG